MSDYKRLQYNLDILEKHNEIHTPVFHLTDGETHEQDLVRELIADCRELLNKIQNGTLIELQDKEENLIGQQVYAIDICSYPEGEVVTNFEEDEDEIIIGFTSNEIVTVNTTRGCNIYHKNGLWFLTKAEAQKKLEELREKK